MNKKIAIVYDWLDSWGGVERVLQTIDRIFPEADWCTSYFDVKRAPWAKNLHPHTSFIQKLPDFIKKNRVLSAPLYPFAFESMDFSEYDIVLSITSSFAKAVITGPHTKHICYMLTPSRFLWTHEREYQKTFFAKPLVDHLQRWDKVAAQRPDEIISLSQTVRARVKKFYDRDSKVIYPPFDTKYWAKIKDSGVAYAPQNDPSTDSRRAVILVSEQSKRIQNLSSRAFYLLVSRLEPYKRIDVAIEAFNTLGQHLVIVGDGTQKNTLKNMAGPNITFLHNISDEELARLYSNAQALIMPQEEDFGMIALEAQFFGCPVIAYKKGGATETIIESKTGSFFDVQTPHALQSAVANYEKMAYTLKKSAEKEGPENVKQFGKEKFIKNFLNEF